MKAETFTRRTNFPKLDWLIRQLNNARIPCAIVGESVHAPILKVLDVDLDRAHAILAPVDDIEDDDEMFYGRAPTRKLEIVIDNGRFYCDQMQFDMHYSGSASSDYIAEKVAALMVEFNDLCDAEDI